MKGQNLIYIFADQLRHDGLGYTGNPRAKTPHLDALAEQSVNFTQAVSAHPVCAPYRACLFTGKYSTSNGMVINEVQFNPHQRCIGHVLGENGYETAYIGKWHLTAPELGNFFAPENSFTPRGPHRLGFDDYWAAYGFSHTYYGAGAFYHEESPEKIMMGGYQPDMQTDLVLQCLERFVAGKKPFAMFVSYGTPHHPWGADNVPRETLERFTDTVYVYPPNYRQEDDPYGDVWAHMSAQNRANLLENMRVYDAMTANLDDNVGRILESLQKLKLLENTIVVFTSDHGECFGAHGRRQKNIFYEEAVRVPFLLRMPGARRVGACDACLNTVDIMPTLLSLLALPVPDGVQGMSLAGRIKGTDSEEPPFAFLQGPGSVAVFADGYEWRAIRDKRYTYARYRRDGRELLFDNQADPYQTKDLASEPAYAARKEAMRVRMEEKMESIFDTFEPCSFYGREWIRQRRVLRSATDVFTPGAQGPFTQEIVYSADGKRLKEYPIHRKDTHCQVRWGVQTLGGYAFYGCKALQHVELPGGLQKIETAAFGECANLACVILPESLSTLGALAFYRCDALRELMLPRGLTSIADDTFDRCADLMICVCEGSYAHRFCVENALTFRVI